MCALDRRGQLLPQQCSRIQVRSKGGYNDATMIVMEPDSGVVNLGLKTEPCLMEFRDGIGHLMIANSTGLTQALEMGLQV